MSSHGDAPEWERATVPDAKITDYLLSSTHLSGHSKADFFMRFGFPPEYWRVLADALVRHALTGVLIDVTETPYGTEYTMEGLLETPDRRNPWIRTVWTIRANTRVPRLITAYPVERRR